MKTLEQWIAERRVECDAAAAEAIDGGWYNVESDRLKDFDLGEATLIARNDPATVRAYLDGTEALVEARAWWAKGIAAFGACPVCGATELPHDDDCWVALADAALSALHTEDT